MSTILFGFDGKLPSRGDFVGEGLPRSFLAPWQDWVGACLIASRSALGDAWLAAWMQAPVWRFALAGGACGPDAALGLIMPSVDRTGRYYPLTVAAVLSRQSRSVTAIAWLDAVEPVALAALASDWDPDSLAARLRAVPGPVVEPVAPGWWTAGSPFVPATRLLVTGLPAVSDFTRMIDAAGAT